MGGRGEASGEMGRLYTNQAWLLSEVGHAPSVRGDQHKTTVPILFKRTWADRQRSARMSDIGVGGTVNRERSVDAAAAARAAAAVGGGHCCGYAWHGTYHQVCKGLNGR